MADHINEPAEFADLGERRHIERRHYRKKPDSNDETLSELWFAIVGTNGEGLHSRVDNIEGAFTTLVHQLNTYLHSGRKGSCFYLADKGKEGKVLEERKRSFRDWAKFALGEGVKIGVALGVFSAMGKVLGFITGG